VEGDHAAQLIEYEGHMKYALFLGLAALTFGCSDDETNPTPDVEDGEGAINWELTGGPLDGAIRFEGKSEKLGFLAPTDYFAVLFQGDPIPSDTDGIELSQMTFEVQSVETGTFTLPDFEFDIVVNGIVVNDTPQALSLRPTENGGTVTVTSFTNTRIRGSFDVEASPTQVNATDLVFQIKGDFTFGKCKTAFCR